MSGQIEQKVGSATCKDTIDEDPLHYYYKRNSWMPSQVLASSSTSYPPSALLQQIKVKCNF